MREKHLKYMIQSEINIVPFLDVLLILLVIFMMVPSQLLQGFEVNLPNSTVTTSIINNNNKPILTIEVKETGLYNIIINNKYVKGVHLNQLYPEIHNTVDIYPDTICLVAADRNVQYDTVIQVLNVLSGIGMHSVGIITNPINSS